MAGTTAGTAAGQDGGTAAGQDGGTAAGQDGGTAVGPARIRAMHAGDTGVLLEVGDLTAAMALARALEIAPPAGLTQVVPGARTVLVRFDPTATDAAAVARAARALPVPEDVARQADPVVLPVTYDGPDLAEVARLTGLSVGGVVRAHVECDWVVAFTGFAPGFGYLAGGDPRLEVPRRADPRPRVPAGSVGLAGEFSGVYPRESPGGWQLIGLCRTSLWDVERDPPALLAPGARVRFEAVR